MRPFLPVNWSRFSANSCDRRIAPSLVTMARRYQGRTMTTKTASAERQGSPLVREAPWRHRCTKTNDAQASVGKSRPRGPLASTARAAAAAAATSNRARPSSTARPASRVAIEAKQASAMSTRPRRAWYQNCALVSSAAAANSAARSPTNAAPRTATDATSRQAQSADGKRSAHSSKRSAASSRETGRPAASRARAHAAVAASQCANGGLSGMISPFSR